MYCFITAYGTERTMILKSQGWRWDQTLWGVLGGPVCFQKVGYNVMLINNSSSIYNWCVRLSAEPPGSHCKWIPYCVCLFFRFFQECSICTINECASYIINRAHFLLFFIISYWPGSALVLCSPRKWNICVAGTTSEGSRTSFFHSVKPAPSPQV